MPDISIAVPVDRLKKARVSLHGQTSRGPQLTRTYSAACAGFRIACNGTTVDPSDISANAKRFCFRTDRMNPFTLISWSSKLQTPPFLLAWRICAHRTREGRELIEL